jgi:hypothetical protein
MNAKILEKEINEEIDAKEAYSEKGALKTLLKGKRDVAFIPVNEDLRKFLEKKGFRIILVKPHTKTSWYSIIYNLRGRENAMKLFKIAQNKHGYIGDNTASEAIEIGRLLGYTEDSINAYVRDKYKNKPPLRIDTPDDYNDLYEQNFPEFEKQIETDEETDTLNKRILFEKDDFKVCAVNADFVRDSNPGLNFNGFTDGGSHYVTSLPGYKKWIPEDEIWIDDVFLSKPNDLGGIILHEMIERHIMKYYGIPYDTAHADFAEKAESKFREESKQGMSYNIIIKIYDEFSKKVAEHHKLKKLSKEYQFQKTKDLMNKVNTI